MLQKLGNVKEWCVMVEWLNIQAISQTSAVIGQSTGQSSKVLQYLSTLAAWVVPSVVLIEQSIGRSGTKMLK